LLVIFPISISVVRIIVILNWKRTIMATLKIHRKQLGVTYS
jgi:hypothetical protein